ncbi:MAG TPA: MBL fold metallo-hydrolase [Egibacteraceae bacterium]|jgi:ribonuclease J|nr:MBL fold metallo-hydrolase [Egibacteraceae bacterium]
MRGRIHRGSKEIGGSCVELEASDGGRVVLDLGRPLAAGWDDDVALPAVAGLTEPDGSLLGVLISHAHLDHYGLVAGISTEVPVYIGAEAEALLHAAAFFSPVSASVHAAGHLRHREPFTLGPFTVTPYLADHSAFDAYSLLVEADGARVFYTGDLRAHGRKAAMFERLLADPPAGVDVLVMEGTHVRADAVNDEATFATEADLEERFVELSRDTQGAVVVLGSAQNLDRLVTVYRAAKRTGRSCVVDLYGATVAAATRATIPQPGHEVLRVYVPNRQRIRVKEAGEFSRVADIKAQRVFPEELAADPGRWLFHVPSSTVGELIRAGVLDGRGVVVWSLWHGYLVEPSGVRLRGLLDEHGVELVHLHTSGHASVPDLKRLVDALHPARVVPMHSEAGGRFGELFPRVELRDDGEWWDV